MSSTPSFIVSPDQYTVEALAPVVNHPDMSGATIGEMDITLGLHGLVAMGRVALAHEDLDEYALWHDYTVGFVDDIQLRTDMDNMADQFYTSLAELRLFGAAAGDMNAAKSLHDMLDADTNNAYLTRIVDLCAQHDITPNAWIAQHAATPDDMASAWSVYLARRRIERRRNGPQLTDTDQYVPGVEQYVTSYMDGQLSNSRILASGEDVLQLTTDPGQKNRVVERYKDTLEELAASDDGLSDRDIRDMLEMAAMANTDPAVLPAVKYALSQAVAREAPTHWDESYYMQQRGSFEVSVLIAEGGNVASVVHLITTICEHIDLPVRRTAMRDDLLAASATLLARSGNLIDSSSMVSNITGTRVYRSALEDYMRLGGDVSLVRMGDDMRQLIADADPSQSNISGTEEWGARADITAFSEQMINTTYDEARHTLVQMAEKIGDKDTQRVNDFTFLTYLDRLIQADSAAVADGSTIMAALQKNDQFTYGLQVRSLLSAHGSAEATAANWQSIENDKLANNQRPSYLYAYAHTALAAVGIRR